MKKSLSFLLIAVLVVSCLPLAGCGNNGMNLMPISKLKESENESMQEFAKSLTYLYDCDGDDYICVLNEGFNGETPIPSEQDGHPVVYLSADNTFAKTKATSIEVPDSVKYIDNVLSENSDQNDTISSISLPESSTVVNSFCNCCEIKELEISKVSKIESSFKSCNELASVKLSGMLEILSSFTSCEALENLELKSSESISDSFDKCTALDYPVFSDVDSLSCTFNNCTGMKTLNLSGITDVASSFNTCTALETINFSTVKSVDGCFKVSNSLKTAQLPLAETVHDSFSDCRLLESVAIPKATKVSMSFENCETLKSVSGAFLLEEVSYSFNDCPALSSIPAMPKLSDLSNSFENCTGIKSTEFARKANVVERAFNGCTQLQTAVFDGVSKIQGSFEKCDALKTFTCTYKEGTELNSYYEFIGGDASETSVEIDGLIIDSTFTGIKALTTATVNGKIGLINSSFNDLPELTAFNYSSLVKYSDSFKNCPKLKTEIMDDEEREEKEEEERKAEEERKKQEELDNEPYGPGRSALQLSAGDDKGAFFRLLKMNSDVEFEVHLDAGESTTQDFPSGRYVLEVIRGTNWNSDKKTFGSVSSHVYSEIYTFEDGALYEISTGDHSDFRSSNPLDS